MKLSNSVKQEHSPLWQVGGIIVQGRPEKLQAIAEALKTLPETEIHAINEDQGKIVAVMVAESHKALANRMEQAREIQGVLAVSLVYHQLDNN